VPSYVLTGAPGAGKTAVLRLLEASGYPVVEEAATDVIALGSALGRAEPWHDHDFIDKVITLQRQRQDSVRAAGGATVFFDRSPVCTLALRRYLGSTTSRLLDREVSRVVAEGIYEPMVFLIRNQGFVKPTAARQISFEDSLVFERLHEQVYRDLGFQLVEVPAGPLAHRAALIRQTVSQQRRAG
jgi:predicted ATPase